MADIRYYLSTTGLLHKRSFGLNVSGDGGACKVSNDALQERVWDINGVTSRCSFCFPDDVQPAAEPDEEDDPE